MDQRIFKDDMMMDILGSLTQDCKIIYLNKVDSTNDYAKARLSAAVAAAAGGMNALPGAEIGCFAVVSDQQTAGRGRLGKTFESPSGCGIYLSVVMDAPRSDNNLPMITVGTAVAVRRAILRVTGADPKIKWVNDLYLRNKKICGILAEGRASKVVIGVGVNCFPAEFPDEIKEIAGPISDEPGSFSRGVLAAAIIDEVIAVVSAMSSDAVVSEIVAEYRAHCFTPELIEL